MCTIVHSELQLSVLFNIFWDNSDAVQVYILPQQRIYLAFSFLGSVPWFDTGCTAVAHIPSYNLQYIEACPALMTHMSCIHVICLHSPSFLPITFSIQSVAGAHGKLKFITLFVIIK